MEATRATAKMDDLLDTEMTYDDLFDCHTIKLVSSKLAYDGVEEALDRRTEKLRDAEAKVADHKDEFECVRLMEFKNKELKQLCDQLPPLQEDVQNSVKQIEFYESMQYQKQKKYIETK